MGRSVKALEAPGGQLGGTPGPRDPGQGSRCARLLGAVEASPWGGGELRVPSGDLCRARGCKGPDTGNSEGGQQDNPLPLVAENSGASNHGSLGPHLFLRILRLFLPSFLSPLFLLFSNSFLLTFGSLSSFLLQCYLC